MKTPESEEQAVVFVIDDDESLREALKNLFGLVGLRAETFAGPAEFLKTKLPDVPACIVLDVRLPGISGLELQTELAMGDIKIPIIFMTGHGDIPMTVKAMKAGAFEFLPKPFRDQDMLDAVQLALKQDRARLDAEQADAQFHRNFESLSSRERELRRAAVEPASTQPTRADQRQRTGDDEGRVEAAGRRDDVPGYDRR